jgi:tripartite-type tricarboxylate transporter receptor subunit TctC
MSGTSTARRCAGGMIAKLMWTAMLAALWTAPACAQEFPSRPIRIIVASGAGGGTDLTGRLVAKTMSDQLRTTVFVENRPGAGSTTGTDYVARAAPDGYTVLVSSGSSIVMNPLLYRNLPYDPLRDFVAVGFIAAYPFMLVTRQDLPAATLAEFVKFAKERPGKLTYGSPGVGSVQHVWGAILFKSLGLDLLHVPYKGAASGHQDLIAGRIDAMFDNMSASRKYVEAGRLKALVVSSPGRAPQLPSIPTINETGLAKFDGESWMGMFAPVNTPPATVDALRALFVNVVRDADFAARIDAAGGRVLAIPPQQQQAFVRQEIDRWGGLIRQYGVTAE